MSESGGGDGKALATKVNRGVAWAAGAQAIIAVADLVSQMLVVALWIPLADYGIAFSAIAFYTMLDVAADLGVTSSLISRDDHTPERVSTVFWFNMIVSGGMFLLLLVLGPLYGYLQHHAVIGWLLIAYGGKLVFQNVYAIPYAMLRKELRFADIAKARTAAHLCESAARIVFAALGATIWCWTLAALTRAFVFGVIVQVRHPFIPKFVFRPKEVTPYLKFGLRSASSQVLYQLYTNLDYTVVMHYFGATANGIYALAYSIVLEPVKTIANVVIDVAFPTFARLRHDPPALVKQFLVFTRLNLIAVLPFVLIVALIIPEFLRAFYSSASHTQAQLADCALAVRILCIVGVLRALGFLGPPLLDGLGKPELTLRYMVTAAILVPASFVVGALVFGDRLGFLSVAVAWAVGYPFAFTLLSYLVLTELRLRLVDYFRAAWGIIGCCVAGLGVGIGISLALPHASDVVRMLAIAGGAIGVTFGLLATWQNVTPRAIKAAMK
ncbi:MAG: oligosaccharide flippase family protein [Proteobacteria bacterium]|nr:oligosaccharide flippase family protein [Pseudomonadota bacterium]